ncbi:MAG: alpha/beta fold hydrolase [Myxococcota bacterium]
MRGLMPIPYEPYPFTTPDGFSLTLYRSRPGRDAGRRPVLLLPGAGSNRLTFGVERERSLPGALNAVGVDVWLLEFRGSRSSRWAGQGRPPISLDHKITRDLPAAVEEVLGITGAERLDLVGHSLGGLFAYLYCGGEGASRVGRLVTLSAPAGFRDLLGVLTPFARRPVRMLAPIADRLPGLGIDRMARIPGPLPHLVSLNKHFRSGGVSWRARRTWLSHGTEDMPGGDLGQIMRWIASGRLEARSGEAWDRRLADVRTPTLLIASAGDRLVRTAAVREAWERLGSPEKDLRIVGRRHGARRDYAHADLLLAPDASVDVYPHVLGWLARPAVGEGEPPGGDSSDPADQRVA